MKNMRKNFLEVSQFSFRLDCLFHLFHNSNNQLYKQFFITKQICKNSSINNLIYYRFLFLIKKQEMSLFLRLEDTINNSKIPENKRRMEIYLNLNECCPKKIECDEKCIHFHMDKITLHFQKEHLQIHSFIQQCTLKMNGCCIHEGFI